MGGFTGARCVAVAARQRAGYRVKRLPPTYFDSTPTNTHREPLMPNNLSTLSYAARTVRRILREQGPIRTALIAVEAGDHGVTRLRVLIELKRMRDTGTVKAVGQDARSGEWIWALGGDQ